MPEPSAKSGSNPRPSSRMVTRARSASASNETQTEQLLSGLSPEFFLQIEWLAGGRFEEGEFLLDSIFDEAAAQQREVLVGDNVPRAWIGRIRILDYTHPVVDFVEYVAGALVTGRIHRGVSASSPSALRRSTTRRRGARLTRRVISTSMVRVFLARGPSTSDMPAQHPNIAHTMRSGEQPGLP